MITSFTCRSTFWLRSRNDSIRTVRPGVPSSPRPASRLGFSEQRGTSARRFSNLEELHAIIGVRVAGIGAGDQEGDRSSDVMLVQPGPGKIAPAIRFFDQ